MTSAKPDSTPPYRLRASMPCTIAGTSSMLRVSRVERRPALQRPAANPQQLAFDFHRGPR